MIIKDILDCSRLEFIELHKFERNIKGNLIFRAKKEKTHVVYGVDKRKKIVFLRAIRNFTEYKKFLDNDKEILRIMMAAFDVGVRRRKAVEEDADGVLRQVDRRKKARFRTRGPYRKAYARAPHAFIKYVSTVVMTAK